MRHGSSVLLRVRTNLRSRYTNVVFDPALAGYPRRAETGGRTIVSSRSLPRSRTQGIDVAQIMPAGTPGKQR